MTKIYIEKSYCRVPIAPLIIADCHDPVGYQRTGSLSNAAFSRSKRSPETAIYVLLRFSF